jgi:hypothetical protein
VAVALPSFSHPNFARKREKLVPVKFVPVSKAFKRQVKVVANRDLNGWVDRGRKIKWGIPAHKPVWIDEDRAREFATKGYVEIIEGKVKPVSPDEAAEFLSQVTVIGMGGGPNS